MIDTQFSDFFTAVAGAAAALIGLLFVAVSVAADRLSDENIGVLTRVRAAAAMVAFSNALVTSILALIPDTNVGIVGIAVGSTGLVFALASARSLLTAHGGQPLRNIGLIVLLVAMFGLELVSAIRIVAHNGNVAYVTDLADTLVASLVVGIARAWDVVGMRSTGVATSLWTLFAGERKAKAAEGHDDTGGGDTEHDTKS